MKVIDILDSSSETRFSLEVFPPKMVSTPNAPTIRKHMSNIFKTVENLQRFDPAFVSVTYNPEGQTKATSIPIAAIIKQRFGIESVAHLTCIGTARGELTRTIDVLDYFDIDNVLALRGDIPCDQEDLPQCLEHACELVAEIGHHNHDFCIGVAAYPEGHPECVTGTGERDLPRDLEFFREKVNQGASYAITQLFLDNRLFFDFVDRTRKCGVKVPILPGIMPITRVSNLGIVKNLCGASIPDYLSRKLKDNRNDPDEFMAIGIDHAVRQCRGLMDRVPCIHFYTMDRWKPVETIIEGLL